MSSARSPVALSAPSPSRARVATAPPRAGTGRYSVKLWRIFGDCFNCMPVSAVVEDKIICMHGGLSPELEQLSQITELPRPTEIPEDGLLCDLLWSDPDPSILGWGYNSRGVSYTFGLDVIREFLERHDLDLVCRAHQVVEDGYEFQANRSLVTVFSAPNYCERRPQSAARARARASAPSRRV